MVLVRQGVPQVMLALDLDRGSAGDVFTSVERALKSDNLFYAGSAGRYEIARTRLTVFPVGLDSSPLLQGLGVASHSMDDYLVSLLFERPVYESLVAAGRVRGPAYPDLLPCLSDCAGVLRGRGVTVDRSKQYLDLLRATLGFRASPPAMVAAILRHAPQAILETILKPLSDAVSRTS